MHFLSGEAWEEYAAAFGRGGVFDAVANYLDSGVRQLAVIQRLGPRPEETIGRLIDRLQVSEGDKKTMDFRRENSSFNLKRRDGDVAAMFRTVSGEDLAPDNFQAAKIASLLRSMQSLTKLGGATLSAFADLPVAAMRLKTNHGLSLTESWHETLGNFFSKIPDDVRDEVGYVIDAICEGIQGDMAMRFDVDSALSDSTNKLMALFFKVNGLTPWTDAMKTGMYMGIASNAGFHYRTRLEALPPGFRETLKMYDLDGDWDVMRSNLVKKIGDKNYLCPELARELPDDMVDMITAPQWEGVPENPTRESYATLLGAHSNQAFNFLPLEVKHLLKKFGLEDKWDFIRTDVMKTDELGVKFIDPEEARSIPDESIREFAEALAEENGTPVTRINPAEFRADLENGLKKALASGTPRQEQDVLKETLRRQYRRNLEVKTAGFLSGEVNRAVLTPDERNRYVLRRGTRGGTLSGEFLRFGTQFKSFPVLFVQQVLKPIFNSRKVIGNAGMLSNAGMLLAQTTLFGAVAMEAKRLARGEKPYIASENPDWKAAFMAAFIQGGGAGLYGDFLLGEYNRFGQSALESFAGPVAGTLGDALKLFGKSRASAAGAVGLSDEPGLTAADVARFTQNNLIPGANIWYAKLALDWAFMWDFQEYLSPGTQARRARRARNEGREYWLSPVEDRARLLTD